MPGGTRYHQCPALIAPASRASCSSPPHETTVGSPSPRNARVASARMAEEMISVVWASTNGITLGSTCRLMTCQCPPPSARARSMYGRVSTASVCARTRRAVVGQVVTPIATTIVSSERDITVARAIASTRVGMTRNQSVIRMITVANHPEVPRRHPDHRADQDRQHRREQPHQQRHPRAPDHQAEQIAPEPVRPEGQFGARILQRGARRVGHVGDVRTDQQRRGQRQQHEQGEDTQAEQPGPVRAVLPPEPRGRGPAPLPRHGPRPRVPHPRGLLRRHRPTRGSNSG